jgi:hypothetical protein
MKKKLFGKILRIATILLVATLIFIFFKVASMPLIGKIALTSISLGLYLIIRAERLSIKVEELLKKNLILEEREMKRFFMWLLFGRRKLPKLVEGSLIPEELTIFHSQIDNKLKKVKVSPEILEANVLRKNRTEVLLENFYFLRFDKAVRNDNVSKTMEDNRLSPAGPQELLFLEDVPFGITKIVALELLWSKRLQTREILTEKVSCLTKGIAGSTKITVIPLRKTWPAGTVFLTVGETKIIPDSPDL